MFPFLTYENKNSKGCYYCEGHGWVTTVGQKFP
jgi:hypothetical protein